MAKRREEPRLRMICKNCGSTQVMRDAWAEWSEGEQDWVLGAVFDYAHCHKCDGKAHIEECPL